MQVLREDGSSDPSHDPRLPEERLVGLYRDMLRAREIAALDAAGSGDDAAHPARPAASWRKPPALGEAVAVGAAAALRPQDWLFTPPGDVAGALVRGVPLASIAHHAWGTALDPSKGRDAPFHVASRAARVVSATIANGAHLTHAAGLAWGARIRRDDVVALALFDDRAVLAGEFHHGVNFAGVFKVPAVFVCAERADGEDGEGVDLDAKGLAYGVPTARCDGADLLSVIRAVRDAVARAAAGEGPTMIAARVAPRAGERAPAPAGRERPAAPWDDPIVRVLRHLEARAGGAAGAEMRAALAAVPAEVQAEVRAAAEEAKRAPPPAASSLFDDVYASAPGAARRPGALS